MSSADPDASDDLVGRLIGGKFLIGLQLGAGAMGRVYRAEQTNLGKSVAIKVLQAQISGDPSLKKRFHREAKHASQLSHPNILQIIDFGEEGDLLYIAMELLTGRDLFKVIRDEWPFTPARIARIVGQILGALDEAHAKGIVHRDLKPENVMLTEVRGEPDFVKVCDFGIAKAISEREGEGSAITVAGAMCGTPEYMSPEQVRGEPLDGRADLYAVAIILYQMVVGETPFRAESLIGIVTRQLNDAPIPPSQKRPGLIIAPGLEALILRGLEKDRALRFADAAQMKEALFDAIGATQPSGSANRSLTPIPPTGRQEAAFAATGVGTPIPTPAPTAPSPTESHASVPASGFVRRVAAPVLVLVLLGSAYALFGRPAAEPPSAPAIVPALAPPPTPGAVAPPSPEVAAPTVAAAPPALAQPPVAATTKGHKRSAVLAVNPQRPTAATPERDAAPATTFATLFAEGEALFKSGAVEAALAKYESARGLNGTDARTWRQIGKCYNRLGQRDRALPYLRRYLELAADAPDAAFFRAMVDGR